MSSARDVKMKTLDLKEKKTMKNNFVVASTGRGHINTNAEAERFL